MLAAYSSEVAKNVLLAAAEFHTRQQKISTMGEGVELQVLCPVVQR